MCLNYFRLFILFFFFVIPYIFVWDFCFWFYSPGASSYLLLPPPVTHNFVTYNFVTHHLSHLTLSHTIFHTQLCHTPSFTYNFVTYHLSHNFVNHHLSHTTLSHTIFHIQLCHTPSFTYNIVTRYISHTTLSHTIFHTQLCHTPSFKHNFVTHHLSHITLSTTIFPIQLCHTPSFTPTFVTHHLSQTPLSHTIFHTHLCHTPWQARHKLTSTVVWRGSHGTDGTGWRAWSLFSRPWRRGTLRGRRGTYSHLPSFCVAGVAQTHIYHRFAWQAWHRLPSTIVLRGSHGTAGTWWRAWSWFSLPWRRGTLRGKRGANSHLPSFCVAGVAQTHIYHRFAWQAWHWWHWAARLVLV